jgi:NADH-quinone oxidoreductase subunit N
MVAVAAMTAGNVAAVLQSDLKKIFAAAGIAQAGFALVAVAAGGEFGNVSLLFYLYVYSLGSAGAFGLLALLEREKSAAIMLSDLAGLERKHYVFSAAAALFLLSLAGIPFTAGFVGIFRVFLSAVKAEQGLLAAVVALNALVAACVYLRIIFVMYLYRPREEVKVASPGLLAAVVIAVCAAAVIALGIFPVFAHEALVFFRNSVIYFE